MFAYFQLQALALAAFSLPFLVLLWNPRPPTSMVELVGLLIWGVGVAGEATADRQLAQFRADPSNQVESVARPVELLTPSELFL